MEKMIWHNKIELPDTEEGLFVYIFDDRVDVEEFEEDFFFASNLIKWAYWEDVLKAVDFFENTNEIKRLKEIDKLKELLKECLDEIHELAEIQDNRSVTIYNFLSAKLLTKIDEVLK